MGKHSQFDIEHIIPFSRSLDNSFAEQNALLPRRESRRQEKQNALRGLRVRMPHDGRRSSAGSSVFAVPAAHAKLRKFLQQKSDEDFAERMLQDTRYMSRLATEYLGLLYGGKIDADHTMRVQVSAGRMTAFLRDEWGLNAILADGDVDEKNRSDHRHHAVDAAVIALTDAATVELLSRSAELAAERGHRLFVQEEIQKPWPTFLDDLRRAIDAVNISYRVNRRVTGALHEETNYSKPYPGKDKNGKDAEYHHVRKPLAAMTAGMIDDIVDDTIRKLVQEKVKDLGGFRKGMFSDEKNHPFMKDADGRFVKTNDGQLIPIHKARTRLKVSAKPVGKGGAARYVATKVNHHIEIVAVLDKTGNDQRWEAPPIVDLREANRRVNANPPEPVVQRNHGPGKEFRFSLAKGEYVEMEYEPDERKLYRVVGVSEGDIEFHLHTDARPTMVRRQGAGAWRPRQTIQGQSTEGGRRPLGKYPSGQ